VRLLGDCGARFGESWIELLGEVGTVKSQMRTPPIWVYKPGGGSLRAGENLQCDSQARF
jgi:hypothetical protein